MLWSEYQKIDQIVLKRSFIRTYKRMGVQMDEISTKTIIFDQGVRKYVIVTEITTFDQVNATKHNYIFIFKQYN